MTNPYIEKLVEIVRTLREDGDGFIPSYEAEDVVRQMLTAMRDPSVEMKDAGFAHADNFTRVWQAMIDAALSEETTPA